jgi:hypothetical protein
VTAAPALCDTCKRSIWSCDRESGPDCLAHKPAECTSDSHEIMKTSRRSSLTYAGVQTDDDGEPILVLLNCPFCASTLAVTPEDWMRTAVHPPRLELVR